jgi:hypothetical protein
MTNESCHEIACEYYGGLLGGFYKIHTEEEEKAE